MLNAFSNAAAHIVELLNGNAVGNTVTRLSGAPTKTLDQAFYDKDMQKSLIRASFSFQLISTETIVECYFIDDKKVFNAEKGKRTQNLQILIL
jgi:hypothetical protein